MFAAEAHGEQLADDSRHLPGRGAVRIVRVIGGDNDGPCQALCQLLARDLLGRMSRNGMSYLVGQNAGKLPLGL